MADHAFPELHSKTKAKSKEPENLLILTRTRTDRHGRRHSVAVPLIPPPDGERFEGGYHVERNPITGGATLVPPSNGMHTSNIIKKCFVHLDLYTLFQVSVQKLMVDNFI